MISGGRGEQIHLPSLKHPSLEKGCFFSLLVVIATVPRSSRPCSDLTGEIEKKSVSDDPTWGSVSRLHSNWSFHNSLSANSACERPQFQHQSGRLVRREKKQPWESSTLWKHSDTVVECWVCFSKKNLVRDIFHCGRSADEPPSRGLKQIMWGSSCPVGGGNPGKFVQG